MKAFVLLNGVLRVRLLPRADVTTFTSVCSVSWEWWMIITNRKWIRTQLLSALWRKVSVCVLSPVTIVIEKK